MHTELNQFIESIAVGAAKEKGLHFSSAREAQQYLEKSKLQIRQLIHEGNVNFFEGLQLLTENSEGHVRQFVAGVAGKILKNLDSTKKLNKIIEDDIIKNDRALLFFSDVINEIQEAGDFHKELCALSVLMTLFPANPQSYVYYAAYLWRKEGKAAAELFYSKITEVLQDPALDYFAADCFIKNGNRPKARKLLEKSLERGLISHENYDNVKKNIQELMERC